MYIYIYTYIYTYTTLHNIYIYIRTCMYIYSIYHQYSFLFDHLCELCEADAPPTSRLGLHLSPIRARLGSDQVPERDKRWPWAMHGNFTKDGG